MCVANSFPLGNAAQPNWTPEREGGVTLEEDGLVGGRQKSEKSGYEAAESFFRGLVSTNSNLG